MNNNSENLDIILKEVEDNSIYLDNIVLKVTKKYCEELDKIVYQVKAILSNLDDDITNQDLDDIMLQLPLSLYTTSDRQELLGLRDDVASALQKEVYSKAHLEYTGKVGEKTAYAENASQKQYIISCIMSRSYKIVRSKVEAGYELLNSVKKIINRRIAYAEMKGE